jgi:hypothetical protein
MQSCGRWAEKFLQTKTGADVYKFIFCMRWFCEHCGKHDGRIHRRRIAHLLERLGEVLDTIALRQFIFTIPVAWRPYFQNRKGMNRFIKVCENIINKEYQGKKCVAYFHAFGDEESEGKFHPHVNIHVIEEEQGVLLRVPPETLQRMKKALWRGLLGYILTVDPNFKERRFEEAPAMNLRYAFYQGKGKVLHKVKYMSRLHPNVMDYRYVRRNPSLARLFIADERDGCGHKTSMKGFSYVRYFNGFDWRKHKDVDRKEEMKEAETLAGGPLRYVPGGRISRSEFNMRFREWDYEVLGDGLYRVLDVQKKKGGKGSG